MAKRTQVGQQQLSDMEWRVLGPRLWDVLPDVTYDWDISEDVEKRLRALTRDEASLFANQPPLERNQLLRDRVSPLLASANADELHQLAVWIVCDWGRIKQKPPTDWSKKLEGFAPATVEQFVTEMKFERLASWSKILAFADSDRYAIYDTRVAVALNIALRAIGESRQFHRTEGQNVIVARAAAALGKAKRPFGYLDYLSLLRALVSERGQTFLSVETTLFAAAPQLAERLMARMDAHLAEACAKSC